MEQQFADEAARHDRPLVDIEGNALDIGAVEQVGGRPARGDARIDQRQQPRPLVVGQARVEEGVERVDRQLQPFKDDERRLVECIGRAVAIGEFGGVEAADRVAEEITDGDEDSEPLVGGGGSERAGHARRSEKWPGSPAVAGLVSDGERSFRLHAFVVELLAFLAVQ